MSETDFFQKVYTLVRKIPYGKVTTYGSIARELGAPGAARMVGWALHHCPPGVPAHRVVNAAGMLTGKHAFPGTGLMQQLLENEGIQVENDRVVDMEKHFWNPAVDRQ